MCKLRKELNSVSYETMDDIKNIINNITIKAKKNNQRDAGDRWIAVFKKEMTKGLQRHDNDECAISILETIVKVMDGGITNV